MSFIQILFMASALLASGCSIAILRLISKRGLHGVTGPTWRETPLSIKLLILGADQAVPVMAFVACYAFLFTK